jgi:hypothetical protein
VSQFYRALVDAVADKMIEGGRTDRVPLTSLSRAEACGFAVDTFQTDVLAEIEDRTDPADPRQHTLLF